VGCPTYEGMRYCLNLFLNRIKELTYPNYDILIVDNSEDNKYFNKIKEKGIHILKGLRFDTPVKTITASRNLIIDYAIKNKYDYLLNLDQDVIPPKNIIEELMKSGKEIISGIYYSDFKSGEKIKSLPVEYRNLTKKEFEEIQKISTFHPFIKSHEDLKRNLTEEEANSGKILDVKIPSNGCMLVKRNAFEKVNYELLEFPEINKTSDDIHFSERAKREGFKLYIDTKMRCEHIKTK
jgi:GT2 family glycosyltransferase